MDNINMFPLDAGFLFPNGKYYSTQAKGHERLAYNILEKVYKKNIFEITDPEYILQSEFSAILIRYRRGEQLLYLPKIAPQTQAGREFFRKAIKFYSQEGFQILNLYKITLEDEFSIVRDFIEEKYERIEKSSIPTNYTDTIILTKDNNYMYNPERIGD